MATLNTESGRSGSPRAVRLDAVLLALGALGISAYLSYTSIVTGQAPAGCGSGSGCAEVLASKWSRVGGVPVSVLAVVVYTAVLGALYAGRSSVFVCHETARFVLSLCAASMIAAAVWFTVMQLVVLKTVCPYCMAGHVLGLLLAVVLIVFLRARQPLALSLGLAGVVLMAVIQINSRAVLTTLEAPVTGVDSDTVALGSRTVTVLDGQLKLDLNNEPLLGEPDAEHVLVVMMDYACPHCRHTHGVIERVLADRPGWLCVVLLPTPLNTKCNPHAPEEPGARFEESCELAEAALAVFLADRSAFNQFDRWLYETPTPRTAEDARSEAAARVGEEKFEQAMSDPRMQQMIARNVHAYGQSGADRVPVLAMPGRAVVVGRVDDVGLLIDLVDRPVVDNSQ